MLDDLTSLDESEVDALETTELLSWSLDRVSIELESSKSEFESLRDLLLDRVADGRVLSTDTDEGKLVWIVSELLGLLETDSDERALLDTSELLVDEALNKKLNNLGKFKIVLI